MSQAKRMKLELTIDMESGKVEGSVVLPPVDDAPGASQNNNVAVGKWHEAWFPTPNEIVSDSNDNDGAPVPIKQGYVLIIGKNKHHFIGLWCWDANDFEQAGVRRDGPSGRPVLYKLTTDAADDFEESQLRPWTPKAIDRNVYLVDSDAQLYMDTLLTVVDFQAVAVSIDAACGLASRAFRAGLKQGNIPGYAAGIADAIDDLKTRDARNAILAKLEHFILDWPAQCASTDRAWWLQPATIHQFIGNIQAALN